jgi:hypothetical protein
MGSLSTRGWVVSMKDRLQPFYARRTTLLAAGSVQTPCPEEQAELSCLECLISAHGAVWYAKAKRRMLVMLEEMGDA